MSSKQPQADTNFRVCLSTEMPWPGSSLIKAAWLGYLSRCRNVQLLPPLSSLHKYWSKLHLSLLSLRLKFIARACVARGFQAFLEAEELPEGMRECEMTISDYSGQIRRGLFEEQTLAGGKTGITMEDEGWIFSLYSLFIKVEAKIIYEFISGSYHMKKSSGMETGQSILGQSSLKYLYSNKWNDLDFSHPTVFCNILIPSQLPMGLKTLPYPHFGRLVPCGWKLHV